MKMLTSADNLFSLTTGSFSLVSERETDLSFPQHNLDSSFSWAMGATLAWAGDDPMNMYCISTTSSTKSTVFTFLK